MLQTVVNNFCYKYCIVHYSRLKDIQIIIKFYYVINKKIPSAIKNKTCLIKSLLNIIWFDLKKKTI